MPSVSRAPRLPGIRRMRWSLLAGVSALAGILVPAGALALPGPGHTAATPGPAPPADTGPLEAGAGEGGGDAPGGDKAGGGAPGGDEAGGDEADRDEAGGAGGIDEGPDQGGRSWPLAGRPAVLRGWEPPAGPYGPGHRGADLAARPGASVLAAAGGRVSFAGRVAGRGVLAIEVEGSGSPPLRTTYEPVRAVVERGDRVRAGQPVAVLEDGPFHCPAGCLHWGLRRGDAYLDPLSLLPPALLRRGPSRLLPVFGVPEPDQPAAESEGGPHPR
ncbi:murein hydrolase activator EnvC family protein [Streptomyces sp. NPDC101181]|uniref:murein hydrolase activator EnvC family protein n=1 Tax=Streptomyces sp. NPDC101181 TaxID=3366125 RepID=UPI0037F7C26D